MKQVETGHVFGKILIHHYSYNETLDRTFVIASATAYWDEPPLFEMTDYISIVVKGADGDFAMTNASSSACYLRKDDKRPWFVYDIFTEFYQSFDDVRYKLPVNLVCGEEQVAHQLHSVTVIYHGMTAGRVSLIEVTAYYAHQAFKPGISFDLIGALARNVGGDSPIEVIPTLTLSGSFELRTIWQKIERAELMDNGFTSETADIQRGASIRQRTDSSPRSSAADIVPLI